MKGKIRHNQLKSDSIPEGLRIVRECPLCKKEYNLADMNILEERDESHLIHVTCPRCHNAILSVVVVSPLGMSSLGVITDLNAEDVLRLRSKEPINEDDVLEFHTFIRKQQQVLFDYLQEI